MSWTTLSDLRVLGNGEGGKCRAEEEELVRGKLRRDGEEKRWTLFVVNKRLSKCGFIHLTARPKVKDA